MNKMLEEALILYEPLIRKKELTFRIHLQEIPKVAGEASKFQQVVVNVLSNAIKAIEIGKALSIDTKASQEGMVQVRIVDTGKGMDPATLSQIGTPFFTTKEHGTGLGMMSCEQIIEEAGGRLQVNSELEERTTVDFFLPQADRIIEVSNA
ncbi:sensor histidine kinase [Salsuginibacillus kocurii]|uniref:sensor histidine kinase n=1 Tax=Salsuginibacillus kocurii TaxID=427078 RepID=UPI0003778AB1|nr:ATP-binding protein [Salsuginibacillus kocurii]